MESLISAKAMVSSAKIDTVNAEPKSQHADRGPGHGGK
jgi:hypothetical protein